MKICNSLFHAAAVSVADISELLLAVSVHAPTSPD